MDNYELIKEGKREEDPHQRLHEYYRRARYDPDSGIFRSERGSTLTNVWRRLVAYFHSRGSDGGVRRSSTPVEANGHVLIGGGSGDHEPLVT